MSDLPLFDPPPAPPPDSLADARNDWQAAIRDKGAICPCCDRFGKVYPRSINRTMARSLVWLAHHSRAGEWVDVPSTAPRWLVRSNQLASLRWWGLVERAHPMPGEDAKHSGQWRATAKGQQFAARQIAVPERVFTYGGEPTGFSDKLVHIDHSLPNFSYAEVMGHAE